MPVYLLLLFCLFFVGVFVLFGGFFVVFVGVFFMSLCCCCFVCFLWGVLCLFVLLGFYFNVKFYLMTRSTPFIYLSYAMGRRIVPSWGGPIELFLVPASVPRLV